MFKQNIIKMESEFKCSKVANYEDKLIKKIPIGIPLFHEMPCKVLQKEKRKTFKYIFNRIRLKNCASATISKPDSTYYVAYLGNVVTGWAKGDGCIEKPLTTLWRNYTQSSRPDVNMQLTISGGGLKVITKNHGLTEYWAHRLTTCAAPNDFPRIFCWVYRHEGKRLKHELRCHAVLCSSSDVAKHIEKELKDSLARALNEFKKDKLSRQNARLSLVNSINDHPSLPRRKILLSTGSHNYRPPLECSRSAPKLSSIEEIFGEEDDDIFTRQMYSKILKSYEKSYSLLPQRKKYFCNSFLGRSIANKDAVRLNGHNQINMEFQSQKSLDSSEGVTVDEQTYSGSMCNSNHILSDDNNGSVIDKSESSENACDKNKDSVVEEKNCKTEDTESEKKMDLDFLIGGVVLPAIKSYENVPTIEHKFIKPFISKGLLEQEQVSLVPVGETQSDFSSLKVYKRKSFSDGHKDIHNIPCIFQTGDSNTQNEYVDQNNSSFCGDNRYEEEISNKMNSTLVV